MNISGINISSQDKISSKQPALDSHESSLRKQITNLQEEMRSISNDKKMSDEQKTKEKQAAQEQLQDLNSELRQYQQQKRQEEAAKKQEAAKEALKDVSSSTDDNKTSNTTAVKATDEDTATDNKSAQSSTEKATNNAESTSGISSEDEDKSEPALLGSKESGVLITLSSTKEQIADMGRIRTSLEGRQRTAPTQEEKDSLQRKINKVSSGIGKKIVITEDAIASLHKNSKDAAGKTQQTADALKQREKELKIYADEQLDAINRTSIINNKKMFDNISIVFS